ncbi:hypothetical protein GCM10010124_24080 [Pilimelia terevasa]|uniref:Putative regulatory protein FmdB zinc ribbon domain-containing protein n=1 Tax=Pilimelia terevasa TaxID=53372 RepID=A0A8J3BRR0_9ACTN|nr:FmdB family zinc ribbon protein [Pilimelia terevasa]GGK30476.1 hypothetical protein GCM10010124_24080 [Pilimelia terevasa]
MPTYQYACTACGHQFEAVQSFSDAALTQCPECAGKLRKLFSAVGVVFKGSGFYRNDARAGTGSKAKPEGGKSEGGKSEGAKPADKPAKSGDGATSKAGTSSGAASSGTAGSGAAKTAKS